MVVCRFAGIRVVEMPVEDGIRTGVGSFEDKLLPFAGEAFRKIKDGVMLRIDQFDLPAPVFAASRFDRRQGSVVDMIVPVIIFFGRRQYEPRACDHPADRFARAVHPETAVRRKMDKPVVGADFRLVGRAWHVERVYPVTDSGCLVPAETADGHREEFVVRHVEPAASRKEREQVEEDGSGIALSLIHI